MSCYGAISPRLCVDDIQMRGQSRIRLHTLEPAMVALVHLSQHTLG